MKRRVIRYSLAALSPLLLSSPVFSESETVKKPEVNVKVGARIQPVYYYTDNEVISDRDTHDFRIRRARISVKGDIDSWLYGVVQTDYSEDAANASSDMRIIDAYVYLKPSTSFQFYAGQFLAPALRQNITSAGSLMTIDRPGLIYKSLSWGTRSLARFASLTMNNTDAGLRGTVDVRDVGMMALGTHDIGTSTHFKYYVGLFEGARTAQSERAVVRAQFNWGDAENGFYHNSSYLGKKDTISIGASYDVQPKVAIDAANNNDVDYTLASVDFFLEKPVGSAAISLESSLISLDLGGAETLLDPTTLSPISTNNAKNAQGQGAYVQTGITIGKWQPWFGLEKWDADSSDGAGSYNSARLGITYLINGNRANIKAGFEQLNADQPFSKGDASTDKMTTFATGLFLTF